MSHNIPEIVINQKINQLFEERFLHKEDRNYKSINTKINNEIMPIRYKVIGNSRASICQKPPLKIKISQAESYYLTTHCEPVRRTFTSQYEENKVVREYFSYELFYRLTKYAFKAKLVKVKYGSDDTFHWGFLSESNDDFSNRTGLKECKKDCFLDLDKVSHLQGTLIQRMIGNQDYDWNGKIAHNFKFYKDSNGKVHSIFYDFDAASIVLNGTSKRRSEDVQFFCQEITVEQIQKAKKEIKKRLSTIDSLLNKQEIKETFRRNFRKMFDNTLMRTLTSSIPYEIKECSVHL